MESGTNVLRIKIISMGDGGVGKSCVIKRFCEEKFVSKYISTIGIDYGVKPIAVCGKEVRVNFWDLSGHPEFFDVRNEFYKDTQGAILMFDLASRKSFDSLSGWLQEAEKFSTTKFPCVLFGNKSDKARMVTTEEAASWAHGHDFEYYETSAKSGDNVEQAMVSLFEKVVRSSS